MKERHLGQAMPVLNIAMVGSDELARELAKPTDQRDVHTYVHKETVDGQARILSLIRPAKYPERLRPLLNALSAARAGLIEVSAVDATLGEALVAFASAGIEHGVAVLSPPEGEWIDEDMVKALFKRFEGSSSSGKSILPGSLLGSSLSSGVFGFKYSCGSLSGLCTPSLNGLS